MKFDEALTSISKEYNSPIEYFESQAYMTLLSNRLRLEQLNANSNSNDSNKLKIVVSFKEKQSVHLRKPCSIQLEEILAIISRLFESSDINYSKSFYSILWTTNNSPEKSSLLLFHRLELAGIESNPETTYTTPKCIGLLPIKFNERFWNYAGSVCKYYIHIKI